MVEKTTEADRFNWRLPSYAVLVAFVVLVSVAICPADTSLILYLFVVAPILLVVSIFFLGRAIIGKSRQRVQLLTVLAILWTISASFFVYDLKHPSAIRTAARWLVWSRQYKNKVLARPASANGGLKHIEWDGWGWGGEDTAVFLVFDPTDTLSAAARHRQPGKFDGIPCAVSLVSHLESHWYAVRFYTNQYWDRCN
jgi:energy-coupling factor transporter transmembrane protein EcfT